MNHARGSSSSKQNFFIFLPGHDISTITLAIAALTVFYDENFRLIDKFKTVEADSRMDKKSFQKTYAVLQMSVDESSAQDGSFIRKVPRRHMKFLNEFFTSKFNGRRWYHAITALAWVKWAMTASLDTGILLLQFRCRKRTAADGYVNQTR